MESQKMENNKKALWVSEDMHHELSIFAAMNKIDIGKATGTFSKVRNDRT